LIVKYDKEKKQKRKTEELERLAKFELLQKEILNLLKLQNPELEKPIISTE
jgi:hypothetical protein